MELTILLEPKIHLDFIFFKKEVCTSFFFKKKYGYGMQV